jgi:DNA-binding XRE family transcriptional regulator
MPKASDTSPEAAAMRSAQKQRLRLLREAVEPVQAVAAKRAGVSAYSWNRMEVGEAEVSTVALARFCLSYGLPSGWVIVGDLSGLPPRLQVAFARDHSALIGRADQVTGARIYLRPSRRITPSPASTQDANHKHGNHFRAARQR